MENSSLLKLMVQESGRRHSALPVVVNNFAEDKRPIGMKLSLTLMKSSSTTSPKSMCSSQVLWIKQLMMNLGVSESSNFSMKLNKNALSSTPNVIIKVHHSSSVVNHLTSEETVFLQLSDPLRFHPKEESPSLTRPTLEERKLFTLRASLALTTLSSHSSK